MIEPDVPEATLKVRIREAQPVEVLSQDFVADSRARTRELLDTVHAVVLGRYWLGFWGGVLMVALVAIVGAALTRGQAPSASADRVMQCVYGHARIAPEARATWRLASRIPERVRASTQGPRTRRVVLAFAHDSTLRWQGGSLFSWQRDPDGTAALTLQAGRAWIALSPLDGMRLDFPGGRAVMAPNSVGEINLRPKPPAQAILRCRRGQVMVSLPQRHVLLSEGQGLQLGEAGQVQVLGHFNADDGWQAWNLKWTGLATQ